MPTAYMASTESMRIDLEREYDLGNETHVLLNKPTSGFWASGIENGTTSWREQATGAPAGGIAFVMGDGANVLELDRMEDFSQLEGYIREYEIREGMRVKSVDWEAVGRDFDAVHVSERFAKECSVAAWDDMSRDFSAWGAVDSLWVTEEGLKRLDTEKRVEGEEEIAEYEREHGNAQAAAENADEAAERRDREASEYVEQTWIEDNGRQLAESRHADAELWKRAADQLVEERTRKAEERLERGEDIPLLDRNVNTRLSDPRWVAMTMEGFRMRELPYGSRLEFAHDGYRIDGNVVHDAECKAQYELCKRYDGLWRETHDERTTQPAYERSAIVERIVEAERWGRAWTFYTKSFGSEALDHAPDRPFFCRELSDERENPGTPGYVLCVKQDARVIDLAGENRGQGASFAYERGGRTLDLGQDQDLRAYMDRKGTVMWDRVARDYDVIKAPADRDAVGLWGKNEFVMPRGQTLVCNSRCIENWSRTEDIGRIAKLVEQAHEERSREPAETRDAAENRDGSVASEYVRAGDKLFFVDTRKIEGVGYHTMTIPAKMSENGKLTPDWNGKPQMRHYVSRDKAETGHKEAVRALRDRAQAAHGEAHGKDRANAKADTAQNRNGARPGGGKGQERPSSHEETREQHGKGGYVIEERTEYTETRTR